MAVDVDMSGKNNYNHVVVGLPQPGTSCLSLGRSLCLSWPQIPYL